MKNAGGPMSKSENLIKSLIALPHEYEWLDFKESWFSKDEIGEYISAYGGDEYLGDSEGAERNQLIAECIFETDLSCGDYD
jgi:hypothetical protein